MWDTERKCWKKPNPTEPIGRVGTPKLWFELRSERRDTCPWCGALIAYNVNPLNGEEMPVHLPGAKRENGKAFAESHFMYCNAIDPWHKRKLIGAEHSWNQK
jgi:uncharacterized Zn-finger protein